MRALTTEVPVVLAPAPSIAVLAISPVCYPAKLVTLGEGGVGNAVEGNVVGDGAAPAVVGRAGVDNVDEALERHFRISKPGVGGRKGRSSGFARSSAGVAEAVGRWYRFRGVLDADKIDEIENSCEWRGEVCVGQQLPAWVANQHRRLGLLIHQVGQTNCRQSLTIFREVQKVAYTRPEHSSLQGNLSREWQFHPFASETIIQNRAMPHAIPLPRKQLNMPTSPIYPAHPR